MGEDEHGLSPKKAVIGDTNYGRKVDLSQGLSIQEIAHAPSQVFSPAN